MYFRDIDFGSDLTESEESSVGGVDGPVSETTVTPPHPTSVGSASGSASSIRHWPLKPRPETIDLGGSVGDSVVPETSWYRPEGDGVSDFVRDERKDHEAGLRDAAGFGFHNFDLEAALMRGKQGVPWVVPGLVPRGELCIFAARGGLGKTTLLEQMMLSVATGRPFLGIPVETGTAVALFHEDSMSHLGLRLDTLFDENSVDVRELNRSQRFLYEGRDYDRGSEDRRVLWDGGKTPNFDDLERKLDQVGDVALLVIDTIKNAIPDEVEKGDKIRRFLSALQGLADRRGMAIVGSTHLNSQGKTAGSMEFVNQPRSVFHLIEATNGVTLRSIKSNCGPEPSPILLERTAGNFWRVRSETVRLPGRAGASVDAKDRGERLRAILFDVIDNHPKKLSAHKQAKAYAPRFAADTLEAQRLRASPSEFEVVMADARRKNEIVEEQKDTRHSTMVLRIADRGA